MADYGFRPVTGADLPMLADWLRQPGVAHWWGGPDRQIALIREEGAEPGLHQVIATLDRAPLGYGQYYPAHRWPAPHLAHLPPETIAIDVFSGPQGWGQGGAWLRALGDLLLARVPVLAIDPDPANTRAIRAYEKAGFAGTALGRDGAGRTVRIMTRRR
ncbi:GNAT family N-acetyltransferase [Paracoccus marinaquae]|uniref:Acetyltransferase n=1 Tax=Paracoccus marinaquae TaxID=2841926 RepID=A0ABS6AMT3_9RHOB|nr:GNAT family N-acetyltransferase [Paracoccus marinaquae]MBU3031407.1 acetyltransferase [Paracoccus marinaquae]